MGTCACGCGARIAASKTWKHGHNGRLPLADHFWPRVPDRPEGDCWEWRGPLQSDGRYGVIKFRSKPLRAHRVAYELAVGPIPDGLVIDHLCRNTTCVNPSHLEPVTQAENLRRSPLQREGEWKRRPGGECPYGHSVTAENAYVRPDDGYTACRACARARSKSRWQAELARRAAS